MRMIQAGDGLCFALESLAQFGTISKMSRKNFNCNDAIEACIAGFINLTHSACTDSGEDFVRTEFCACRKWHRTEWAEFTRSKRR